MWGQDLASLRKKRVLTLLTRLFGRSLPKIWQRSYIPVIRPAHRLTRCGWRRSTEHISGRLLWTNSSTSGFATLLGSRVPCTDPSSTYRGATYLPQIGIPYSNERTRRLCRPPMSALGVKRTWLMPMRPARRDGPGSSSCTVQSAQHNISWLPRKTIEPIQSNLLHLLILLAKYSSKTSYVFLDSLETTQTSFNGRAGSVTISLRMLAVSICSRVQSSGPIAAQDASRNACI